MIGYKVWDYETPCPDVEAVIDAAQLIRDLFEGDVIMHDPHVKTAAANLIMRLEALHARLTD